MAMPLPRRAAVSTASAARGDAGGNLVEKGGEGGSEGASRPQALPLFPLRQLNAEAAARAVRRGLCTGEAGGVRRCSWPGAPRAAGPGLRGEERGLKLGRAGWWWGGAARSLNSPPPQVGGHGPFAGRRPQLPPGLGRPLLPLGVRGGRVGGREKTKAT